MSGYNVLIPDSSRDLHPELMLPIMDGLQQLEQTPVVMSMSSIRDMYKHTRYVSHGSYEIFQFYVQDLFRKHNIDFGVSIGLSAILEDGQIQELHHVMEECSIPNLLYLNAKDSRVIDKLQSIGAESWQYTYLVCSSRKLCELLREAGFEKSVHAPLGTSTRIFHPADAVPANAAFELKLEDERLCQGYEVSFVGCHSPNRERILYGLREAGVKLAIFGDPSWQDSGLKDIYRGSSHYLEETNTVFNSSRITLDIPLQKGQFDDYVSNRVSDSLASNCILLTPENQMIRDLLGSNSDHMFYREADELAYKIERILADDEDARKACAAMGQLIRSEFSWDRCLQRVMPSLEMCLLRQKTN